MNLNGHKHCLYNKLRALFRGLYNIKYINYNIFGTVIVRLKLKNFLSCVVKSNICNAKFFLAGFYIYTHSLDIFIKTLKIMERGTLILNGNMNITFQCHTISFLI